MARNRAFIFVVNNPTELDEAEVNVLAEESQYTIFGREKGDEGTPHLQGYVYFKDAKTFESVRKKISRAHIEPAKGSPVQNQAYCSKQGDFVEFGVIPKQGKRNDIEQVVGQLREGANMRGIVDTARSVQSVKMAEIWLKYNETPRTWKPEVRWYHGSTGSGKTRAAREWLGEDIYTCLDSIKWFEGYDQHENVLIDDFRKDFCKFHQLLKLLDRYDYKVETKGGSRQLLAKKIAITAPFGPDHIYDNREDVQQLIRRIDEVILVGTPVRQPSVFDMSDELEIKS